MIVLAELEPLDPVAGVRKLLRACSANDSRVTGLNNVIWRPAISEEPTIAIRLFKGDFDGTAAPSGGALSLQIDQFERPTIEPNVRSFIWAGAKVRLWAGNLGQAWPWTQVFEGSVESFEAEANTVQLRTKANQEPFEKEVLTVKYAGTGGAEGGVDLKDKPKPFLLGRCANIEPVLINAVDNVYQVSGYGPIEAITMIYERGSDFGASTGDFANYAALVAAAIPAGGWATCIASGMFRLGAPAYGLITADVDGDKFGGTWRRKTGEIILRIASNSGVPGGSIESASFTAIDTALNVLPNQGRIGIYITDQVNVLDVAARLAAPCNAQVGISLLGRLFASRTAIGSPVVTLDAQQRQLPRVISSAEQSVSPPYTLIEMGYARCWRVHGDDEIALYEPVESANNPNSLTIDEKIREVIPKENARSGTNGRYPTVRARMVALGLSVAALDTASANWLAHRNGIATWNNIAVHSTIVRTTWDTLDKAFDDQLNLGDIAISEEDAKRATIGNGVVDKSGNPVAIEHIRNNLAILDWWKKGATIPWILNSESNSIVSVPADASTVQPPIAGQSDVWFCQEVTGDGEAGGGWGGAPIAPLDPDQAYRFLLPVRRLTHVVHPGPVAGAYWGVAPSTVADLNTTTVNTNPYFAVYNRASMLDDRWYLFIGYIFPRNSIGKNSDSAGVWDTKTGQKVGTGLNFCFLPSGVQPTHRAFQFYAGVGSQQMMGKPLIELIDRMADPASYFEEQARLNSAIGINGSGQFINPVGAGNNTVVANTQITVNGSGQIAGIGTGNLSEVGNDRLDLAFDTSGTAGRGRALLRRGGGTVVNSTVQLPATLQNIDQLWSEVNARPANLTALAGTEAIQNTQITINGSGQVAGIGTGNNTVVANNQITITTGSINGIGTGNGAEIGNDRLDLTFDTAGVGGRGQAILRRAGGTIVNSTVQLPSALQNADQLWAQVSGIGRPEDLATVGARAGTNLRNSANVLLSDSDVITASGTAAAIAGQGALATLSAVGSAQITDGTVIQSKLAPTAVRLGTNIVRADGTTSLTDALAVTSLGTAAAITGQGPGATATAAQVMNNRIENSVVRVAQPVGGVLQNQLASVSGAIRIMLPTDASGPGDSMIRFFVDVYEYVSDRMQTYEIAGYTFNGGPNTWIAVSARMIGGSGAARPVRFGQSGGKWALWIGDNTGTWAYPAAVIRDVQVSYGNLSVATWESGWAMAFDTAAPTNVTFTVLNPNAGDAVFGVNARETWNGTLATLNNFRTNLGTAAGFTGQGPWATVNSATVSDPAIMQSRVQFLDGSGGFASIANITNRRMTLLRRADGTTDLTEAMAITSLGTAAAIAGQGALATLGAVGSAQITDGTVIQSKLAPTSVRLGTNIVRADGTTSLTDALAVTSLGTAAAITGQGALATLSAVGSAQITDGTVVQSKLASTAARLGTNIVRADGTTSLTDALAVTSLGTAAAITGQGALATLNSADFTTQVGGSNKPEALATNDRFADRRNTNELPSWYFTNFPQRMVNEFKDSLVIGIPGGANAVYGALVTYIDWTDISGGQVKQQFTYGSGASAGISYVRTSTSLTAWGTWTKNYTGYLRPTFDANDLLESGSTVATLSNFRTSLGTAAAIAGQGALATLSAVGSAQITDGTVVQSKLAPTAARLGTNVVRADGATSLTDALAVTSLGTAAAIAGQGGLATKSAVAWATEVTGRDAFLTDGRIPTGLDAAGRNQVGIVAGTGNVFSNTDTLGTVNGTNIALNPEFLDGSTTGWALYDNSGGGRTSMSLISDATAPNASGNILRIAYNGTGTPGSNPTPGYGGAVQFINDAFNATGSARSAPGFYSRGTTIIYSILARLPVGYNIEFASNNFGSDGSFFWMTSTAGTGGWQRYIGRQIIGTTGTFSSTAYLYAINGPNVAFNWDIAKFDQIDITSAARLFLGRGGLTRQTGVGVFDADAITSLGTSAAITGQGALATLSAVGSAQITDGTVVQSKLAATAGRLGTNIVRADGATSLTDALAVTSLGTAAAIAGQGTLATRNNARLGTELVDESGNALPPEYLRNNIDRGSISLVSYPVGGNYNFENDITGAIRIRLPGTIGSGFNTMIKFQVDIYDYAVGRTTTYDIGGYVFSGGPNWINVSARVIGGSGAVRPVRFCRTGGAGSDRFCLVIGETNTLWSYPKVIVRDFMSGYSAFGIANWQAGWNIDVVTTLPPAVDGQFLTPTAGDSVFGVNALETWNGTVATLGNFKTNLGTAAAITGQGSGATANTLAQLDATAAAQLTSAVNGGAQSVGVGVIRSLLLDVNQSMSYEAFLSVAAGGSGGNVQLRVERAVADSGSWTTIQTHTGDAVGPTEPGTCLGTGSWSNNTGLKQRFDFRMVRANPTIGGATLAGPSYLKI